MHDGTRWQSAGPAHEAALRAIAQAFADLDLTHGRRPDRGAWEMLDKVEAGEMNAHAALCVLVPGGRLILCGGNDEGIRSASALLEELCGPVETLSTRGHGRIARALLRQPDLSLLPDEMALVDASSTRWRQSVSRTATRWLKSMARRIIPSGARARLRIEFFEHLEAVGRILVNDRERPRSARRGERVSGLGIEAGAVGTGAGAQRGHEFTRVRVQDHHFLIVAR